MKQVTRTALAAAVIALPFGAQAADMRAPASKAPPAEPVEHYLPFSGLDVTSHGTVFGYVGAQVAPSSGGLDSSGLRYWFLGGTGKYKYPASDDTIRGTFWEGDALIGYGIERDNFSANMYVGLNVQSHLLSAPYPENSVHGTAAGLKVQGDVWINPTSATMLYTDGSYSTAFQTYYATAKAGYAIASVVGKIDDKQLFFGPQATVLGNERFQERRIGGHLTTMNWGKVNFEVSAGYLHNTDYGSGFYSVVEINTRF